MNGHFLDDVLTQRDELPRDGNVTRVQSQPQPAIGCLAAGIKLAILSH